MFTMPLLVLVYLIIALHGCAAEESKSSEFEHSDLESVLAREGSDYPSGVHLGNYHQNVVKHLVAIKDKRISFFKKKWIEGKDILDIGCSSGLFVLSLAREYAPRSVIGMDLSMADIMKAEANLKIYREVAESKGAEFPNQVSFIQDNYVLGSDIKLKNVKPQYDTITCMYVSLFIHLKNGESGLKRLFKRVYRNLRPGGRFIFQYHPLHLYRDLGRKSEIEVKNMKFRPEEFENFLKEIGFVKNYTITYWDPRREFFSVYIKN